MSDALRVWRGPPLADFVYESFAQAEISRLEEVRLQALEERIEAGLALGDAAELVPELELLVAHNPYRERLRGASAPLRAEAVRPARGLERRAAPLAEPIE